MELNMWWTWNWQDGATLGRRVKTIVLLINRDDLVPTDKHVVVKVYLWFCPFTDPFLWDFVLLFLQFGQSVLIWSWSLLSTSFWTWSEKEMTTRTLQSRMNEWYWSNGSIVNIDFIHTTRLLNMSYTINLC